MRTELRDQLPPIRFGQQRQCGHHLAKLVGLAQTLFAVGQVCLDARLFVARYRARQIQAE
ncbi:hypothetical protein GCM10027280_35370 [Micromonospora polyrhachis]|uniref:Uncharacterized protein n=1 Tax=Micromonospora polyrhachis TaxID=1282883 RepID=A0A7W7SSG2_9ACTN|nr:hypothetical protein [Micromonospora polyrhachis]MBB4958860.1 hypothetical protein [Micromonospora polyrhachis]